MSLALLVHLGSDKAGNVTSIAMATIDVTTGGVTSEMCEEVPYGSFPKAWAAVTAFVTAAEGQCGPGVVLVPVSWGEWHLHTALPEHAARFKVDLPAVFQTSMLFKDLRSLWEARVNKRTRTLTELATALPEHLRRECTPERGAVGVLSCALKVLAADGVLAAALAPPLPPPAAVPTAAPPAVPGFFGREARAAVQRETLDRLDLAAVDTRFELYRLARARGGGGAPAAVPWVSVAPMATPVGPCPIVRIEENDTLVAAAHLVRRQPGARVAVLNMSSSLRVGGGYLGGAGSQEEELCRCTSVVPTLLAAERAGYIHPPWDTMMYAPAVRVLRQPNAAGYAWLPAECQFDVGMLVAAALRKPKLAADGTYSNPGDLARMQAKIMLLLTVAAARGHRALVLGAWGTGAYGNPTLQVARLFREALLHFGAAFDEVVFAVLDRSGDTFRVFESVFPAV